MDTMDKLKLLADDSRYDLACACGTAKDDRRKRNAAGDKWLYPVSLPNGGKSILLKTLMSNTCTSDCAYCPLRDAPDAADRRRCTLSAEEIAKVFMDYLRRGKIFGLFLSSSIIGSADATMERMIAAARVIRGKYGFRGYMHMKIIPGCDPQAITEMLSLASAVSLNVEVPTAGAMSNLSQRKNFQRDIVEPIRLISRMTDKGSPYARVKQTTQFIVGASDESDRQIIDATYGLYKRLRLDRVYYSAYQVGGGSRDLPGERRGQADPQDSADRLTREHRLYQSDFLIRKYGFNDAEIPCDEAGRLSLTNDPKQVWADLHPELFPVDLNRADKLELLKVPGLGPLTVNRILKYRRKGGRITRLSQVGMKGKLLAKTAAYLKV